MTIRTFTPNPAVDETVLVEDLRFDVPLRPVERRRLAGGKGINVARTVHLLGGSVRCHGVVAGDTGAWLAESLHDEGLDEDFVVDRSDTWRTRTTQVISDDRHAVLLYDRGEAIPPERLRESAERCLADLLAGGILVVSGSLPDGDHLDTVCWLLASAAGAGASVVVDSSGPGLRAALKTGVDVIKVDREEAAEVTGVEDPADAARALLDGCRRAIVTAGADGAVAAGVGQATQRIHAPRVDARHPAGSGDAFAGALAVALAQDLPWSAALQSAAAAGAANTLVVGAGAFELAAYRRLLPDVTLETI
ncbi:1-phosphofructokinase family hexose kinase [Egicoccus sp. AB-alg2]|uniref:1-phosphofructokinase family hexose kinase n=1 Tax=Egicoccus sp. AB-alg2 TaxID=3242693 RepID=UPI00359DEEFE